MPRNVIIKDISRPKEYRQDCATLLNIATVSLPAKHMCSVVNFQGWHVIKLRFRQVLWQRHHHHPSFWPLRYKNCSPRVSIEHIHRSSNMPTPTLSTYPRPWDGCFQPNSALRRAFIAEVRRGSGYWTQKSILLDFQAGNAGLISIGFQAPLPWGVSSVLLQLVTSTCHCIEV